MGEGKDLANPFLPGYLLLRLVYFPSFRIQPRYKSLASMLCGRLTFQGFKTWMVAEWSVVREKGDSGQSSTLACCCAIKMSYHESQVDSQHDTAIRPLFLSTTILREGKDS